MFDIIRKIWRTGTVTMNTPFEEPPSRYRGKPVFVSNRCSGCASCMTACPCGCIEFLPDSDSGKLSLSYAACIHCGICAEVCETQMIQITNQSVLAAKHKEDFIQTIDLSNCHIEHISFGRASDVNGSGKGAVGR